MPHSEASEEGTPTETQGKEYDAEVDEIMLNEEEQRSLKGYLDRITDSLERKCGVTEDWQEQRRRRMRRFTD